MRFGRLVVLGMTCGDTANDRRWHCRCDCGGETFTRGYKLNSGTTKSCGCISREPGRNATHGHSGGGAHSAPRASEYRIWSLMKDRCLNPRGSRYKDYGGRGIAVCDRWMRYENFLADMGRRPSTNHTLERRNNEEGYNPENCLWATPTQQSRNRRNTVMLTHDGITLCLSEWAERLGLHPKCLRERLRLGWSDSQALGYEAREKYGARSKPNPKQDVTK